MLQQQRDEPPRDSPPRAPLAITNSPAVRFGGGGGGGDDGDGGAGGGGGGAPRRDDAYERTVDDAILRDPMLRDPGELLSKDMRELARKGDHAIQRQVGGGSQKMMERVLPDPMIVWGLSKKLGSTEYYRLRKAGTADKQARVAAEAALDGGQHSLALLAIDPDESVGVYGAHLTIDDPKFWLDDETTIETFEEFNADIERLIGRAKYTIATGLMAKYNNPPGIEFEDIEARAGSSYPVRLLECYSRWSTALYKADVKWRGKSKGYSKPSGAASIKVKLLKYYGKERKHAGVTGRAASLIYSLAWLVELRRASGSSDRSSSATCWRTSEAEVLKRAEAVG